jgi:hypothetical protein
MKNIKAIINGNLQPWNPKTNLSDDYYSPELRKLQIAKENFISHYKTDFGIVPFSVKIKYYQKVIDNDIVIYINNLLDDTAGGSENLSAFKLDKAQKKIRSFLVAINDLIERKQFDISVIASKYADFKTERNHKECTFIFNYLLIALVRCWLEIQANFIKSINEEEVFSIADIYSQILQKAVPEKPQIQEILTIVVKSELTETEQPIEKEESFAIQYAQEKYSVFMDEVNQYRFLELQKLVGLDEKAKNRIIKELVENPLHYSIAMLSFLGYIEHLKKKYSLAKEKIYRHIAKALNSDDRSVKGNCLVLNPNSTDDRYKYKADQYIEKVEEDYNTILSGKALK